VFCSWLLAPALGLLGNAGQTRDILREAAAAYQSGDVASAIRLYREFLTEHPGAAEIRSNLGAALVANGQFPQAIEEYQKALGDVPSNTRVRTNLALAYYKVGRLPEAIEDLEVLHELQPLEVKPALLLADCQIQTGQPAKAVQILTPLHEEYPEDRAVIYLLGMALLKAGRLDQAQLMLDKILREGESAEAAFLMGQSEYLRQNIVPAATHLARAVELDPKLFGAHSLYGQVLRSLGKLDEANLQFGEELKINPYDYIANVETAMQFKDAKSGEALRYINRALQVRPRDPGALLQRASLYTMQGRAEDARKELEQLLRDYPDFAEAHAALATVYYKLNRKADGDNERAAAQRVTDEAQKRLEESLKRERAPKSPGN
jgi:tetratricopeptide (TPR) repeat protein